MQDGPALNIMELLFIPSELLARLCGIDKEEIY